MVFTVLRNHINKGILLKNILMNCRWIPLLHLPCPVLVLCLRLVVSLLVFLVVSSFLLCASLLAPWNLSVSISTSRSSLAPHSVCHFSFRIVICFGQASLLGPSSSLQALLCSRPSSPILLRFSTSPLRNSRLLPDLRRLVSRFCRLVHVVC